MQTFDEAVSACLPSPWIQHHYPGERQYVSARTAGNEPSAIIPHAVISGGPSTRAPCSPLMEWTRQKTSTIKGWTCIPARHVKPSKHNHLHHSALQLRLPPDRCPVSRLQSKQDGLGDPWRGRAPGLPSRSPGGRLQIAVWDLYEGLTLCVVCKEIKDGHKEPSDEHLSLFPRMHHRHVDRWRSSCSVQMQN